MPKVRGPLFSLNAAGTLGKAITYKKGTAGNVVRKYYKPKGTRNAAQAIVRTWFQRGVWTWQGLSDNHGYYFSRNCYGLEEPAREDWRDYRTTGNSFGYYAFMKRWISRSLKGLFQYQIPPNVGFCVADEWLANFLYANGQFHDWTSALPPIPPPGDLDQYVAGIIALWHMDDDVDPIIDSSGNGNTGAASGSPTNVPGVFSNCEYINGANEFYTIANESNFDFEYNQPFSVIFYLKANLSQNSELFGKAVTGGTYTGFYGNCYSTGKLQFRFLTVAGQEIEAITTNSVLNTDTWYQVLFTYDGSGTFAGMKIYVNADSKPLDNKSTSPLLTTSILNNIPFTIGRIRAAGDVYGRSIHIDEMAFINRELSPAEALEIYNNNLPLRSTP